MLVFEPRTLALVPDSPCLRFYPDSFGAEDSPTFSPHYLG